MAARTGLPSGKARGKPIRPVFDGSMSGATCRLLRFGNQGGSHALPHGIAELRRALSAFGRQPVITSSVGETWSPGP
jgi:hypothetical protein